MLIICYGPLQSEVSVEVDLLQERNEANSESNVCNIPMKVRSISDSEGHLEIKKRAQKVTCQKSYQHWEETEEARTTLILGLSFSVLTTMANQNSRKQRRLKLMSCWSLLQNLVLHLWNFTASMWNEWLHSILLR